MIFPLILKFKIKIFMLIQHREHLYLYLDIISKDIIAKVIYSFNYNLSLNQSY